MQMLLLPLLRKHMMQTSDANKATLDAAKAAVANLRGNIDAIVAVQTVAINKIAVKVDVEKV